MTEQQVVELVKRSDQLRKRSSTIVFSAEIGCSIFIAITIFLVLVGLVRSAADPSDPAHGVLGLIFTLLVGVGIIAGLAAAGLLGVARRLGTKHAKEHLQAADAVRTLVKEKFAVELPTVKYVDAYRVKQIVTAPEGRVKAYVHVAEDIQVHATEKLLPAVNTVP